MYVGRCAPAVAVHLEPGGGLGNDGPRAVVLRRYLDVDAPRAAFQRAASAALPRGFTGSGNLFFHLGVDADPPDRGSLFHQAGALVPSGAIHSRVGIEFAPLDQPRVAPTFV